MDKVKKGDTLTAARWNEVVGAVKDLQGAGSQLSQSQSGTVLNVKSNSALSTGDTVALTTLRQVGDFATLKKAFLNNGICFNCSSPSSASNTLATVIESCPAGGIAKAVCPGLFQASINITNSSATTAVQTSTGIRTVNASETETGMQYRIVARSTEATGTAWAYLSPLLDNEYDVFIYVDDLVHGTIYRTPHLRAGNFLETVNGGSCSHSSAGDGIIGQINWTGFNANGRQITSVTAGSNVTFSGTEKNLTIAAELTDEYELTVDEHENVDTINTGTGLSSDGSGTEVTINWDGLECYDSVEEETFYATSLSAGTGITITEEDGAAKIDWDGLTISGYGGTTVTGATSINFGHMFNVSISGTAATVTYRGMNWGGDFFDSVSVGDGLTSTPDGQGGMTLSFDPDTSGAIVKIGGTDSGGTSRTYTGNTGLSFGTGFTIAEDGSGNVVITPKAPSIVEAAAGEAGAMQVVTDISCVDGDLVVTKKWIKASY